MTEPLSTLRPTDSEIKAASELVDELTRQKNFESTSDTNKRYVPSYTAARMELSPFTFFEADFFSITEPSSSPPYRRSPTNLLDRSAENKDFPKLLLKLLEAKSSHMGATDWVSLGLAQI